MSEMKIEPLFNQVALRRPTNQKTAGGLFIPETADLQMVEVVATGPGIRDQHGNLIEMSVKVGDIVVVDARAPMNVIRLNDEKLYVVPETSLLGRIAK